jgi:DnaK suppressor protein
MTAMNVEKLKAQLEAQKAKLIRDLEVAKETAPSTVTPSDEPSYSNHLADEATTTFQQQQNLALEQHTLREVNAVDSALDRIRAGTYGNCDDCGQPIGQERLEALPSATLCIRCKSRREARR